VLLRAAVVCFRLPRCCAALYCCAVFSTAVCCFRLLWDRCTAVHCCNRCALLVSRQVLGCLVGQVLPG
jgi:hypothetical protein